MSPLMKILCIPEISGESHDLPPCVDADGLRQDQARRQRHKDIEVLHSSLSIPYDRACVLRISRQAHHVSASVDGKGPAERPAAQGVKGSHAALRRPYKGTLVGHTEGISHDAASIVDTKRFACRAAG